MGNRFGQKLCRVIDNIRCCRLYKSDVSSGYPGNLVLTTTGIHRIPPHYPESFDIPSLPSFTISAPPSTPDRSISRSHHVGNTRLSGWDEFESESSVYALKKDGRSINEGQNKSRGETVTHDTANPSKVCSEETVAPLLTTDTSISLSDLDSYSYPDFFSERPSLVKNSEITVTFTGSSVVPQRLMPREEGKVRESIGMAVVKRSNDPMEDFKKSMWEMVVEKEMFTTKELEQLLICFLSLNPKGYHPVIVEAFVEIWQLLFMDHYCAPSRHQLVLKSTRDH